MAFKDSMGNHQEGPLKKMEQKMEQKMEKNGEG